VLGTPKPENHPFGLDKLYVFAIIETLE
jgi:hypothetical protein